MAFAARRRLAPWNRLAQLLAVASCAPLAVAQSSGQTTSSAAALQVIDQHRNLKVDEVVEARLAANTVHAYDITAEEGQFLHVIVEQDFGDLTMSLFRPDGREMGPFDVTSYGTDATSIVTDMSGVYRLTLRLLPNSTPSERYSVTLRDLRAPLERDRKQIAAEAWTIEAKRFTDQATAASLRSAISRYEEALALWRELDDRYHEAHVHNSIGFVLNALGENQRALEHYREALVRWNALEDLLGQAEVIANIGAVHSILGEKREAIHDHEQAMLLRRRLGDRRGQGYLLNNLAATYAELGESERAVELLAQSVPLLRDVGDQLAAAAALQNMGVAFGLMGELQKALEHYTAALTQVRAVGDRRWEGRIVVNIGTAHRVLGDPRRALEWHAQSLALSSETGDRRTEGSSLTGMGAAHKALGDRARARDHYDRALQVWRAVGDRRGEGNALLELGEFQQEAHETAAALETFERAFSLLNTAGDRRGEALALRGVGAVHAAMGDATSAETHFLKALDLARQAKDRNSEPQILVQLARLYRTQGRLAEARARLEAALPVVESVRAALLSHELRAVYLGSRRQFYEAYIDVLMALHGTDPGRGFDAIALETSERMRARTLLDVLTESAARIREGADATLLAEERRLQQLIMTRSARRATLLVNAQTETQIASLDAEIDRLVEEFRDLQGKIRATSPRYAALAQPEPLSAAEIQRTLDSDTLLIEYSLGEDRSYAWAVTSTAIHSVSLPPREMVETAARQLYADLTIRPGSSPTGTSELDQSTARLSRMILDPLPDWSRAKRVIIVADGALQYIPFAALMLPSHARGSGTPVPLAVGHEIVSLPSASIIAVLRRELAGRTRPRRTVAVIADPVFDARDPRVKRRDARPNATPAFSEQHVRSVPALERSIRDMSLPSSADRLPRLVFARQEADAILSLAQPTQTMKAVDFAASRSTATSGDLADYRIVHLATHGVINTVHPELSGIVLSLVDERGASQDGFLQLHDIYNLRLPADLVVLSSCQSGLGAEIRGEGLVGLTRGVMYAGAARVVVSLWKVDDEATAELMKRFYKAMLGPARMTAAAALSAAQATMRLEKRWKSPYFWAGFVLQGEWN